MILFRAAGERGMSQSVGDDRIRVSIAWVRDYYDEREKLEEIRALADRGVLKARVAKVFPAEEAADAHRLLEAGGLRGHPVIEF
jgi:NADPH:quinone reductase